MISTGSSRNEQRVGAASSQVSVRGRRPPGRGWKRSLAPTTSKSPQGLRPLPSISTARTNAHQRRSDRFRERRAESEAAMGPLSCSRDDSISYARISLTLEGGSGADEAEWPEIQTRLAKAMIKFHETLSPINESDEFRAI